MKLSNAVDLYLVHLLERNLSPLHLRTVRSRLAQFVSEPGKADKAIHAINALELHQHFQRLEEAGLSEGTMAGYAGTHRAFWMWVESTGLRDNSPAANLKRYSYLPKKRRAAPVSIVDAISSALPAFAAADGYSARNVRDALAVSLSLDSGNRLGEIRSLRRRDMEIALRGGNLSANGRMCHTVVGQGKTGAQELTFFNESADLYRLWQMVNPYPKADFVFISLKTGKLLGRDTIGRAFVRVCEFAGVPPIRSHAIRKRNASDIQAAFRDPELTRQYLGHTSINTTMRHYNDVSREGVISASALMSSARRGDPLDMLFKPRS